MAFSSEWLAARGGLAAAAVVSQGFLHRFARGTRTFLDAPDQLVLFAFDKLKVIISELGPLLLELAFGDVPVSFELECVHMFSFVLWFLRRNAIRRPPTPEKVRKPGANPFAVICFWDEPPRYFSSRTGHW